MKHRICILLIFSLICFNTCDILRFSKFEVISWTPGGGYHSEPGKIVVSLLFSHDPDKAGIERNFSLTGNGNNIRGRFSWEGKKLIFSPLSPLDINTDYTVNISANASSTDGLSMDEAFSAEFTTRKDNSRPVLISFYPAMYEVIDDPRINVKLHFSVPVPVRSLYENVSFSPSMAGLWLMEDEGKLAVFCPSEPWIHNNRYEIRFSSSLTDTNGMNIGNDFYSIFSIGSEREMPYLLEAGRITKDGYFIQLISDKGYGSAIHSPAENADWEKDDKISFVFSKPVDTNSVKNYLSVDDGPGIFLITPPGFHTEIIFGFENYPAYESRFTLRLKPGIKDKAGNESRDEYIYRVFANGKYSKPPVFSGIRMPMAPNIETEEEEEYELKFFGADSLYEFIPITDKNYPSGEFVSTWMELYFSVAQGALIDPFSVMEHFRIETSNNVISFSLREVKTKNFTIADPHPGFEDFQRIEITGNLINSTNFGIIYFLIAAGLKDNLGNRSENSFRIPLIK